MTYTEVTFTIQPYSEAIADALISELGNLGYDGFSCTENGFTTYIKSKDFSEKNIHELQVLQHKSLKTRIGIRYGRKISPRLLLTAAFTSEPDSMLHSLVWNMKSSSNPK